MGTEPLCQEQEIERILAATAESPEKDNQAPALPSGFGLLKYRAANDNSERAWMRWVWLALALAVPVALAVALIRLALGFA